jgi:RNA polymerase sigma factor (sigma-70 family)
MERYKMAGILLATWVVAWSVLGLGSAQANAPLSFDSCEDLRQYLDSLEPYAEVRLAPSFYVCREPINPAVDGLTIDFGGSTVRVADQRPTPEESVTLARDGRTRSLWLAQALDELSLREQTIIKERRLRDDARTLEELGHKLGISKERVRQIEHRALEKLKSSLLQRSALPNHLS